MSLKLSLNTFFLAESAKEIKNWKIEQEHINVLKNQIYSFEEGYYCAKVLNLSNKEVFEKYKPDNIELIEFVRDI